mmetsp:Transcript_40857/g.92587  ORF Transcript_40857/g.92587 Transcript_40857/m.92587 type:complete len:396 (-) Transcript_40857:139-1326(-)
MVQFGYSFQTTAEVCRILFLTKLHNSDLWRIWQIISHGGIGFTKGDTEAPISTEEAQHWISLVLDTHNAGLIDSLIKRADCNNSGDMEFEELALVLRAINPQLARVHDVADVPTDAHPLIQQVQALAESHEVQIMYAEPQHAAHQAARGELLGRALRMLKAAGAVHKSEWPSAWSETIDLLKQVASMQFEAAGTGASSNRLGEVFLLQSQADSLCRLAQALLHAVEMLETHDHDAYETHVALRTIRTVGEIEQVLPSRRVAWKMGGTEIVSRGAESASHGAEIASRDDGAASPSDAAHAAGEGSMPSERKAGRDVRTRMAAKGGRRGSTGGRRRSVAGGSSPKKSQDKSPPLRRQTVRKLAGPEAVGASATRSDGGGRGATPSKMQAALSRARAA